MGRLKPEMLGRMAEYADRVLDVAEALERQGRSRRVVDQVAGCGTSIGANTFEADQAMTRKDFARTMAITAKELGESRFRLRLVSRRGWIKSARPAELLNETDELLAIRKAMIVRTRGASASRRTRRSG